jgi:hypothetical protein
VTCRRGLAAQALFLAVLILAALCPSAFANHGLQEVLSTGPIGGNGPIDANFGGATPDGNTVFLTTTEKLVSADTDNSEDVYQRTGGVTTLISIGPNGGNGAFDAAFDGASTDGTHVFFHTAESLVSADFDSSLDIYERSGGTTTILSQGPTGGNGPRDAFYTGASKDGGRVWFISYESLVSADNDSNRKDVYEHSGGTTTLISTGPNTNGPYGADYAGASDDGTHVFFVTDEPLVSADTDGTFKDVYERFGGTTSLVSTGPNGGGGAWQAFYGGTSADGTHVFFQTAESLVSSDTDSGCTNGPCSDVYERFGGTTTLVSTSPTSSNGPYRADFSRTSQDGSHVFFTTDEPLVSADTDSGCPDDLGNPTKLCIDVYERSGGTTTLVSTSSTSPNGPYNAGFDGASPDGTHVFFDTDEPLASSDSDSSQDVYERFGGTTTQVSIGQIGGNGNYASHFLSSSQDSTRLFFWTFEALTTNDTDAGWLDIYERFAGTTTLISTGPASPNGAAIALFAGSSNDGTRLFFVTDEKLVSSDTDSNQDVYVASVLPTTYPRPGSGSPLRVPLVPAYARCTAPNTSHVEPLSFPSCDPVTLASSLLTTSTVGRGGGFARFDVIAGDLSTPQDEADVNLAALATDVRNASDGSDYVGKVILTSRVRITDRANGTSGAGAATVQDLEFSVGVDCLPTIDTNIGSSCNVSTTSDTLVPNFAQEGKRAVISWFSVELEDAGPDGTIVPPSNPTGCPPTCGSGDEKTYMVQGVYAP